MPSKKPYMQARTDQDIIDKMQHIAKNNSRSLSKEIEYICKQHIAAYEAEHGKIIIKEEQ